MKDLVWTVCICLVLVGTGVGFCDDWQAYKKSMQEGNGAAQDILSELNSPQKIEDRISSPVANPEKSFTTFALRYNKVF